MRQVQHSCYFCAGKSARKAKWVNEVYVLEFINLSRLLHV